MPPSPSTEGTPSPEKEHDTLSSSTTKETHVDKKAKKGLPRLWKILIPVIVVVVVLIIALIIFLLPSGNNTPVLHAADIQEVTHEDITERVSVTGTIEAEHSTTLYTTFTAPVLDLPVHLGDRVTAGQTLIELDSTALQTQLDTALSEQDRTNVSSLDQLRTAQDTLAHSQELLDKGLDPNITSAEASVRTTTSSYDDAVRKYNTLHEQLDSGTAQELRTQENNLISARKAADEASLAKLRAGYTYADKSATSSDPAAPEDDNLAAATTAIANDTAAREALERAEEDYNLALEDVNTQLADAARSVDLADAARRDAVVNREAAYLNAQYQLKTQQQAVETAQNLANANLQASDSTVENLQKQIDESTVRAPHDGVISALNASLGQAAAGALVTVSDDSELHITASIKEADISKVAPGSTVTFTTPATGTTGYTGRVESVADVASTQNSGTQSIASAATSGGVSSKSTFPIDIVVTGNTEGLHIGGSARARITQVVAENALTVPSSAVYTGPKGTAVLVVNQDHIVEERLVTTGDANDVSTAILPSQESTLAAGDLVIRQPSSYQKYLGQKVDLSGVDVAANDTTNTSTSASSQTDESPAASTLATNDSAEATVEAKE